MREFEYITEDDRLLWLCDEFKELPAVAIDFEEECNLHAYGEHISIIQIYDRKRFYIVDVLSNGITDKSLEKLFSLPCEKIWFECHSDLAILYKKHNIKATGVYDLRVLAKALGTSFMEIDIRESVLSHFRDIGHSEDDHSVTYENAQARERTQVLMDIANKS